MPNFRERLRPSLALYLGCLLIVPAVIMVFLPVAPWLGLPLAAAVYAVTVITLTTSAPVISVQEGVLSAGKATIDVKFVGRMRSFSGNAAREERGPHLDARAWLAIRGWIDPVIKVEIIDPDDPTPYWLVSTRRAAELTEVIAASKELRAASSGA